MTRGEDAFFALRERLAWLAFEPRGSPFGMDLVFGSDGRPDYLMSA